MPVGEYSKQQLFEKTIKRKYPWEETDNTPLLTFRHKHPPQLVKPLPLPTIKPPTLLPKDSTTNTKPDYIQSGINAIRTGNTIVGITSAVPSVISSVVPEVIAPTSSIVSLANNIGKGTDIIGSVASAADLVKMGFDKGTDSMNFDDAMRLTDDVTGVAAGALNLAVPMAGTVLSVAEKVGTGLAKIIKAEIEEKPKNFGEFWDTATDAVGVGWMNKDLKDAWKEDIKPKLEQVKQTVEKVNDWGDMSKWKERANKRKEEKKKEKKVKKEIWKHGTAKEKAHQFFFG